MTPREVIARAICRFHVFGSADIDIFWMDHLDEADAVIDALEGMEVTGKMWGAGYSASAEHAVNEERVIEEIWRAMVGAMRDE